MGDRTWKTDLDRQTEEATSHPSEEMEMGKEAVYADLCEEMVLEKGCSYSFDEGRLD